MRVELWKRRKKEKRGSLAPIQLSSYLHHIGFICPICIFSRMSVRATIPKYEDRKGNIKAGILLFGLSRLGGVRYFGTTT